MNFTYNANKKQMEYFINLKFLEILVAQMTMRKKQADKKLVADLQEAIENVLKGVDNLPERYEKLFQNVGLEELYITYKQQ